MLKGVKRKAAFFKLDEILRIIRERLQIKDLNIFLRFPKRFKKQTADILLILFIRHLFYILFLDFTPLHYSLWWQVGFWSRLMNIWMGIYFGVKGPISHEGTIVPQAFNNVALTHCAQPHSASFASSFCCHLTWLPLLHVTTAAICSVTLMSWL